MCIALGMIYKEGKLLKLVTQKSAEGIIIGVMTLNQEEGLDKLFVYFRD